ncbi:hypothetical protein IFM89_014642 [Coptis chinensis]|uniref:Cytochrome P450 n=1 Tax=Coptis chinensis TaxID=261450 RepID=A0A835LM67_9MAGN|nr:hypothetical protein IFM89_014642 [Coptis chinensis]
MMELAWPLVVWSGFYLAVVSLLLTKFMKNSGRLPPGPPGWPLIGNIFDLDAAAHHTLAKISNKYGPIVWLRLGAVNTMVVSSAEAAMDMFKNHDLSFAGRTTNEALRVHCYDEGSMALGQYGPYWRMLRRICTTELFTNSRINGTESLRMKCIDNMIRWIWDEAKITKNPKDAEFFTSIAKAIELGGRPNIADFFPFLRWLDPQGIKRKMRCDMAYTHKFAYGFVEERILERKNGKKNTKKDFLDVLLDFQGNQRDGEPENISEKNIGIMILELFAASTDTTTSTIEWALTELLRNPSIMRNVQAELDQVLVQNKMEEVDVGSLRYLQAVVKETLRLHPPVPLLIPRRAMDDTKFMGYSVPKDTQILVNVWAIGRDPVFWDDPLSFKPERFLSSNIDYKGRHFQFIPFGAGRRICVGMSLAHRTLHLALGSLIQSFEWALEDGVTPENMDMTERLGVALRKADPLKTVLKLRVGKYKGRND